MTKIFMIAGEASGDQLGGAVIRALKSKDASIEFRGIGGSEMLRAGLTDSLFKMEELSLMGVMEVVPKIPKMLQRIAQTAMAIKVFNPDIVLTIDSPDFSFRVQKEIQELGIKAKRVHFVAPTVWAWRPERAKKIAQYLDGLICLFPFEPPYFEKHGLKTISVGHPLMTSGVLDAKGDLFRQAHSIPQDRKMCGLFFGSRKSEIDRLSDVVIGTAKSLQSDIPGLGFIVPTLPRWHEYLSDKLKDNKIDAIFTSGSNEKWDAFAACDAAIAVSGTVALEIAVAGIPHVILYRMNRVTWEVVRRMVTMQNAHLVNIMLKRNVIPEFIQDRASVDKIVPAMKKIILDAHERKTQKEAFEQVQHLLQPDKFLSPADQAAEFLMTFCNK